MSEVTLKVNNPDKTTGTTKTTSPQKVGKPTIFMAGLTRTEAESCGLMDLFTTYNKDGDDEISDSEFEQYTLDQQKKITSSSGKRVAQGGVYTVQKGDSLSLIANDFGIDVNTLYKNNKDIIGNNKNILQIGQQLKIDGATIAVSKKPQGNKTAGSNTTANNAAQIFATMTREQAESAGGTALETFEAFSSDGKTISSADFKNYQKVLKSKNLSVERQQELASMPKTKRIEYLRKKLNESADFSSIKDHFKGLRGEEALEFFGVNKQILEENGFDAETIKKDPKKFGKFIGKHIKEKADTEVQNTNSEEYQRIYQRLKSGDFTEFEIKQLGLAKGTKLSDDQLKIYTEKAIRGKYQAAFMAMISDTNLEGHEEFLESFLQGIKEGAVGDDNELKGLSTTMVLTKAIGTKSAASMAEAVAKDTKAYGIYESSQETAVLATRAIIDTGSPETVQTLIEQNPNQVDIIQNVVNAVIAEMPDGAEKTALINAVNRGIANIEASNSNGGNSSSAVTSNNNRTSYTSNPITAADPVITRTQGKTYYSDLQSDWPQTATNELKSSTNAIMIEMKEPEQTRYLKQKIQGMPKEKLLSLIAENYSIIPDKYKSHIRNYFVQMPPNVKYDMYLRGSDELRNFMTNEEKIVQKSEIYSYLAGHHAELVNAPKSVQDAYEEYMQENKKDFVT